MGLETALIAGMAGLGTMTATTQVMAGRAQAKSAGRQGEFNAQVYEQQASMVEAQKKVQETQDIRRLSRLRGSIVAATAGKGLLLSGSPAAILVDAETQAQYDMAIGQYNLEIDKRRALSGAEFSRFTGREQARLATFQGYTNAFSTALNTAGMAFSLGGRAKSA